MLCKLLQVHRVSSHNMGNLKIFVRSFFKMSRPSCGRKGTLCRQFSSSLPGARTSPSFPLDCSDFHSSQGGSHPCATCLRLTILMQWWCCWQGRTCVSQASCSPPSCPFLPRDSPALEPGALAPWSPWKVSHQEDAMAGTYLDLAISSKRVTIRISLLTYWTWLWLHCNVSTGKQWSDIFYLKIEQLL